MLRELKGTEKLSKIENLIIDARCQGMSINQISQEDLTIELDDVVLRLSAITGCPLPNTNLFAQAIIDELRIFINDFGYKEFTLNEFMLAFRINAHGSIKHPNGEEMETIKFTGSSLNIDYIAKVLNNYRIIRNLLDRKLQNQLDGYEL